MLTYSKWTPDRGQVETVAHVRAHLSSIAAPDDDPDVYASEVEISLEDRDGGLKVTGTLDREPSAPYLRDDWTVELDVRENPLSVPSIEGEL